MKKKILIVILIMFFIIGGLIIGGAQTDERIKAEDKIIAAGKINKINLTVTSKFASFDTNQSNKSRIIINITSEKTGVRLGNLSYTERYYILDESGTLKFENGIKYYDGFVQYDNLTLKILRPNSSLKKPYTIIKATINIDNQTVFQDWVKNQMVDELHDILSKSIKGINVSTKFIGYDRQANMAVSMIYIMTDRLGNLSYVERYFSSDEVGKLKYETGIKYYDKDITNNSVSFKILRPNNSLGEQYDIIEAEIKIDNQTVYQNWIKKVNFDNQTQRVQNKYIESKNLAIVSVIITFFVVIISTRNNNKKK